MIPVCIAFLLSAQAQAQLSPAYLENVRIADSLTQLKKYGEAAAAYTKAFAAQDGKATTSHRYNAACVWALAGNRDSAFYHLFRVAENNCYSNYNHIIIDNDLVSLHEDPRWQKVLATVKANKEKEEENYIKPIVAILDTVYRQDQKYRADIAQKIGEKGMEDPEVQEILKLMDEADSINLLKVTAILDEYGWLGSDKVGRNGALTIFLVIQHAPFEVQKKYLPMMREAVAEKRALAGNLALLEDRVALGEGKKQIYGSQIIIDKITGKPVLEPLEDPDNVDKRRAEMGLGPIATYLKEFGIVWDVEAYKKN